MLGDTRSEGSDFVEATSWCKRAKRRVRDTRSEGSDFVEASPYPSACMFFRPVILAPKGATSLKPFVKTDVLDVKLVTLAPKGATSLKHDLGFFQIDVST